MWEAVVYLILGLALVLAAVFGKTFYAGGLRPGARVPIPAWQGRTWLLIFGILIALIGVAGLLGDSHSGLRNFVERAFVIFKFGSEMFAGAIALFGGVVFLLPGKDKVEVQARLMGAGLVFFGLCTDRRRFVENEDVNVES